MSSDSGGLEVPGQLASDHHISVFIGLNFLLVLAVALFHTYSSAADLRTALSYRSYVCLIALETGLLFLPALVAYWGGRFVFSRTAILVGALLTMVASAVYFADLAVFLTLREHLLTSVLWKLFVSVLPFLPSYIHLDQWLQLVGAIVGWIAIQFVFWKTAGRYGRRPTSEREVSGKQLGTLVLVGMGPILVCLVPAYSNWDRTLSEVVSSADRHPIASTGFFQANRVPQLQASSPEAVRGKAWMLANADQLPITIKRYQGLTASLRSRPNESERNSDNTTKSQSPPDVLLVISECLRADTISEKTTPNIYSWARKGFWLKQHYTVGNASSLSFFGIMFGLEADLYEHAGEMPIGLFDCLKQAGYRTGFFAWDDFSNFGMTSFVNPSRFDVSEFVPPSYSTETDQTTVKLAGEFFARSGKYATDPDPPRVAIVYLFAPHDRYSDPQDQVHTPADVSRIGVSERRNESLFIDFIDSVRFIDRSLAPLLDQSRVTFITGDHGESFGEDGRSMHGSALSKVQLNVACVGFGPGIPNVAIQARTSHVDLFPTIADAVGIEISDPRILPGVSLLHPIPKNRVIACRTFSSANCVFLNSVAGNEQKQLGYQGFFNWKDFTLAPGAYVDKFADALPSDDRARSWDEAEPMRQWLQQRFGPKVSQIPLDPVAVLHETILAASPKIQVHTIVLLRKLGDGARGFESELRECLQSPHAEVREASFALLHDLYRQ